MASLRSWDLITNRCYLRSTQLSFFGTRLSWWFSRTRRRVPRREQFPANVFNTYTLGGYLTWRLSSDYLDRRALPAMSITLFPQLPAF